MARLPTKAPKEPTKAIGFSRTRTSRQARADYMKRRTKAKSVLEAGAGPYQTPTIQDYAAGSPLHAAESDPAGAVGVRATAEAEAAEILMIKVSQ